eukprot:403364758
MHLTPKNEAYNIEKLLPWNFSAHLMRKPIENLDSPVTLEKYVTLHHYNSLFKNFAEAIQENDYETISEICEPTMAKRIGENMEIAHKEFFSSEKGQKKARYQLKIENHRKHTDETELFLFNVENYLLVNCDINRQKIKDEGLGKYKLYQKEQISFQTPAYSETGQQLFLNKNLTVNQVINPDKTDQSSRIFLVMRLHLLVTTYLNMYVVDSETGEPLLGHSLNSKESQAHKKSHIMIVDKKVSETFVGDSIMDQDEQISNKLIKHYTRDEEMYITDFDNYMRGNPYVRDVNELYEDDQIDSQTQEEIDKRIRDQLYEHRNKKDL